MKHLNVMTIDDDKISNFLACHVIKLADNTSCVTDFDDGEMAYKYIQKNLGNKEKLPDVIITDLNMRYMSGWEFIDKLKPILNCFDKKVKILISSAYISDTDLEASKNNPLIDGYLGKPFDQKKLESIMAAF
jgi:CheY-like chemotaxis protein